MAQIAELLRGQHILGTRKSRSAANQAGSVGSSRTVTAPDLAPTTTRLPCLAKTSSRRSTGSHSRMCLAAYEQLSHPESGMAILISEMLAMLEGNSRGGISDQVAVLLISVMIMSEYVFTY
jgi:hypothetical protein